MCKVARQRVVFILKKTFFFKYLLKRKGVKCLLGIDANLIESIIYQLVGRSSYINLKTLYGIR
jgi:hypothetical protein